MTSATTDGSQQADAAPAGSGNNVKYFYYRIFYDNLAIPAEQPHDPKDPCLRRVASSRILSPQTVGGFKRAVAQLEGVNVSRIGALRIGSDSDEALDTAMMTAAVAASPPGTSPDQALSIILTLVTNGVAEPVFSQTEPSKVAHAEKPLGWKAARINRGVQDGSFIAPFWRLNMGRASRGSVARLSTIFVDPLSSEMRSMPGYIFPMSSDGSHPKRGETCRVIVARTREIGYILTSDIGAAPSHPANNSDEPPTAPRTENDIKYFYYRIFDDSLAIPVKQHYDPSDPCLGRVASSRILRPQTIGGFKRAVAKLEYIDLSRVAALRLNSDGTDAVNTAVITTVDSSAPGASPARAFNIALSEVINDAA